ncbi:dihydropteroate synthase [Dongia sp.]|uniref:dihydropteroate synthase n=1 Tax=Dongia sp. TaxID=1977262 RepID=UPI0035B14732
MAGTYLIPTAMLAGSAAERAVAAGTARRLAGGPVAFAGMESATRDIEGRGIRRPVQLADLDAAALAPFSAPPLPWAGFDLKRALIMGIVNVTPDSFSDGGDYADASAAAARGIALAEAGADILDIGGESTRPGSAPVSVAEEIGRVVPVIRALAEKGLCVSVDTRHAPVMAAAVEAGARIINDVTALTGDPESERVAAGSGAAIVLMHMLGEPQTMQANPVYADVTLDLIDYFAARLARLEALGVGRSRISLDPGIGFGKKDPHNLRLLNELAAFHSFGCPITLGVSRKSFIGRLSRGEAPKERLAGSLTVAALGLAQGVQIVRVHDVPQTFQMRAMVEALRCWQ